MTTAKKTPTKRSKTTATRKRATTKKPTATRKPRTVAVKKRELPPNPLVHEILEAVDSERVRTKKVDLIID